MEAVLDNPTAASELARACEDLTKHPDVYRHHVSSMLTQLTTLAHTRGVGKSARGAVDALAFELLRLCSEHELQQMHAVLGGGFGGARREVLKSWRDAKRRRGEWGGEA